MMADFLIPTDRNTPISWDLQTSKELDGGEINYGFSALHVTIDDPQDMAPSSGPVCILCSNR